METLDIVIDLVSVILYIYIINLFAKKIKKGDNKLTYIIGVVIIVLLLARKAYSYIVV